jgi:phosphoribosylformylglycinamidine synthase
LQGLGGSAYLQAVHGIKNGTPPRIDLESEHQLHQGLRSLIYGGGIQGAHDCSEGGLAVALAESCISHQLARETPHLVGADIDLSSFGEVRVDALLFGETQSRIIISVRALDAVKVIERAKIIGIPVTRLGTVGGASLRIKTSKGEFSWSTTELHDLWWNAIARLMS